MTLVRQNLSGLGGFDSTLSLVGALGGAYHGYKRTQSIGWTIGWAAAGYMFPLITGVVSYAQGFGKKK